MNESRQCSSVYRFRHISPPYSDHASSAVAVRRTCSGTCREPTGPGGANPANTLRKPAVSPPESFPATQRLEQPRALSDQFGGGPRGFGGTPHARPLRRLGPGGCGKVYGERGLLSIVRIDETRVPRSSVRWDLMICQPFENASQALLLHTVGGSRCVGARCPQAPSEPLDVRPCCH
jgi:hypothetical protein